MDSERDNLGPAGTNLLFAAISNNLSGLSFLKQVIEDTKRQAEESIQSAWRFHSTRSIVAGAVAVIDRLGVACAERGFVASKKEAIKLILELLSD